MRDLLYREFVVLLVIWLAIVVPVACHHGPMSLLEPGGHAHHASDAHANHSSLPLSDHRDQAASSAAHASTAVRTTFPSSHAPDHGSTALAGHQIVSFTATAVPIVLSLFAGVLPTDAAPPALAIMLFLLLRPLIIRPQWALSPPLAPPRIVGSLAIS